ncbi:hypothetical protein [Paenibacillus gansuensis]|uniref:N-acetyltransferase domain-containing protein n=1 Tax=Paenibacillus gansuensis TaxID=306542 RepID=A0ABW5PF75_9BACL
MRASITIGFEHTPPSYEDYSHLCTHSGHPDLHVPAAQWDLLLGDSRQLVSVYDNQRLIGFGRLPAESLESAAKEVSIVDPAYADKGIEETIRKLLCTESFRAGRKTGL